jgi:DeoR/GlpR family transcriptional regulator of sugar metabolism
LFIFIIFLNFLIFSLKIGYINKFSVFDIENYQCYDIRKTKRKRERNMAGKLDTRRKKILEILARVPISSTMKLAAAAKVSSETMRKDLDALALEGLIIKVHGGVALANTAVSEIPFDQRAAMNADEKRRIAQAALHLIQKNDSIVLESCTTNLELAKALVVEAELLETLVVITNSFSIATVFEGGRKCQKLFFLGGWANPAQYSVLGYQTAKMLGDFHINKSFISGAALSEDLILTGYYDDDVAFQKRAIASAKETVLMIDRSKFGQAAILSVAHLSELDYLVTDKALDKDERKIITKAGVNIVSVSS